MKVYKFSEVIKHFKSKSDLARTLNVTRQAVNYWKSRGEIPLLRAYELERILTDKGITPNVYESSTQNSSFDNDLDNSFEELKKQIRAVVEKELREEIEKELREKITKEYEDKIKRMLK